MKPAPFDYVAPTTVPEALDALAASDEARVLAGGQSLLPLLNLRLARPQVVVDVNGVGELDHVDIEDGVVRIGAITRHRRVELDPQLGSAVPLLVEAARYVGHPHIRNRATVGGSIAHADPVAEFGAVLVALEGRVVVQGPHGRRTIPADEWYQGYFTTAIQPGEMLLEVELPTSPPGSGHAFREFAPRHGDFAVAGVAAVFERSNGSCARARLAACGVGSVPVDLADAANTVVGATGLDDAALREVAQRVGDAVQPVDDVHGSAEYRRELTQLLAVDALRAAWERSEQGDR
ncbi:MAG: xanthine dehydrogenase family protein subunit M [Acidimicrobiia bacterium]